MAKQQQVGGGYYFTPQSVTTQVDWSQVSKNVSDTLEQELQARNDRRQDIEDATNETVNSLQEAMKSEHIDTNTMAINFASDATDNLMIAKNAVMNGTLSQREYNIISNNVNSGAKNMGTLVKSFNEDYAEWQRRTDAGENIASIEAWLAEKYYGFSKFGNVDGSSKPYINPMTGEVSMGIMRTNDKGVLQMSKNKNDYSSVLSLLGRNKARYKHYDPVASAQQYMGTLGEQINVIAKGNIQKRNDLLNGKGIYDPENAELLATLQRYTQAELAYTPNFAAVLNDNIGSIPLDSNGRYDPVNGTPMAFDYTVDPEEAKTSDHWILMTNDSFPVPIMDNVPKGQMEMYEDFQIKTMLSQVKKEETYLTPKTTRGATAAEIGFKQDKAIADSVVPYLITALESDNKAEVDGALSALSQINPDKKYSISSKTKQGGIQLQVTKLSRDPETGVPTWGRPETVKIATGGYIEDENGNPVWQPLPIRDIVKNALPVFADAHPYVDLTDERFGLYDKEKKEWKKDKTLGTAEVRTGVGAYSTTDWGDIKEKFGQVTFNRVDEVFDKELKGNTHKAQASEMMGRLNQVIFTEKNLGPAANKFSVGTTSTGRLIERFEVGGQVYEVQTPLFAMKDGELSGEPDEDALKQLRRLNNYIYRLLRTQIVPSKKTIENRLEQDAPDSAFFESKSLVIK